MKRKHILILVLAVLMTGLLAGCGKEANETDETVTQESLDEESKESEENDALQDKTAGEIPDWLAAYANYIEGMEDDAYSCGFFYADGDDIPELIIRASRYDIVLTFHDGVVDALQIGRLRIRYIEKKNRLCVTSGQAGEYTDQIYSIENGKWTYVAGGKYFLEFQDGMYVDKFSFEWEGEEVEEELYWENFHQVFDEEQAVVPKEYMRCDTMLSHIEAGDFAWVLTAEPYTYTYNAEIIEDFEYSDEYIPISKVDFASYKNEMDEEDWQALSSFFPILLEGKTFMVQIAPSANEYTDDFEEHSINDLLYASGFDQYPDEFVLDEFALCDLTGDGQKELVVYTNFSIGLYCVFHKEGDNFYAVWFLDRWFENLQKNGIYIGDDGASTSYFQRLHFLKDVFWGEEIAVRAEGYYENYHVIGGEKVSEAEMEAWEDEMMVGKVVWYDARANWELIPDR